MDAGIDDEAKGEMMWRSERGQNLAEVAIIAPLLLLLLAGVADLGRAFYAYNVVSNAAREGARHASRYPLADISVVQAVVATELDPIASQLGGAPVVTRDFPGGGTASGSPVRVTVRVAFTTLLGGILGMEPINISARTEMVIFGLAPASRQQPGFVGAT